MNISYGFGTCSGTPCAFIQDVQGSCDSLQGDPQSGIVEWLQLEGNLQQGTCFNPMGHFFGQSRGEPPRLFYCAQVIKRSASRSCNRSVRIPPRMLNARKPPRRMSSARCALFCPISQYNTYVRSGAKL